MMTRFVMLVLLAVSVSACGDSPAGPRSACAGQMGGPGDVARAKACWAAAGPRNYTFVGEHSCFCGPEVMGPALVTVRDGVLDGAIDVRTRLELPRAFWFKIEDLFALIESQRLRQPLLLEVEYDPKLGYPTRIKYGTPQNDAGGSIFVSQLVASAIASR